MGAFLLAALQSEARATTAGDEIYVLAHAHVETRPGDRRLVLDRDLDKPLFRLTDDDISVAGA